MSRRESIREVLRRQDAIHSLPEGASVYALRAADSGFLVQHLAGGDVVASLAVAVRGGRDVEPELTHHRSWGSFLPHDVETEHLVRGIAMGHEAVLLRDAIPDVSSDDHVGIVDGSHSSIPTAVASALGMSDDFLLADYLEDAEREDLIGAIEHVLSGEYVVGCPKSDSSVDLHRSLVEAGALDQDSRRIPDKVLASMVLDGGEVLTHPSTRVRWERTFTALERCRPAARDAADRLRAAVEGVGEMRVYHVKPVAASMALRVETKATVDAFTAFDLLAAVCSDCDPPFTQEPLIQYLADVFAKTVSVGAGVQLDAARLELASDAADHLLEYVLRNYRT